jgi:hypothetical protein
MDDLQSRYLQKLSVGRTQSLAQSLTVYAKGQAAIEAGLFEAVPGLVEAEVRQRLDVAVAEAKEQSVSKWDLLQSQHAQRLLLYKVMFDLRAMGGIALGLIGGLVLGGAGGLLFGYLIWGRSPPPELVQVQQGQSNDGYSDPKNTRTNP